MADTPKIPKGHKCEDDSTMSSGFSNWDKRMSGGKPPKDSKKGGY